jgi:hypothetical protein
VCAAPTRCLSRTSGGALNAGTQHYAILYHFPNSGKFPKVWEISQTLGNFPEFGKFPKVWEISQTLGNFPEFQKSQILT